MIRIRFLLITSALLFAVTFAAIPQQATTQQPPRQQSQPISVQNIKGAIYQVKGGAGANTGFFVANKCVLVVDAKMTEASAKEMIAEIKKITPNPISYVVLTHSDGDHVNGLVGFPTGLDIIAQTNTRSDMEKAFTTDQQRAFLPTSTFSESMTLHLETGSTTERVDILYFGPAHTAGDAVVFFPTERVAFIGDLLFLGRDPLIHRAKNGTSLGLVRVLKALLTLDVDTYLSGHNDPVTKKEIEGMAQSIEEKQAKIKSLISEGKSLDDVKKIFQVPSPAGGQRWQSLVEVIYLDLTEKK